MTCAAKKPCVYLLALTLLGFQFGCATDTQPGLSESVRTKLGTIGLVSAQFLPETEFDLPPGGALEGAGKGVGVGASTGADVAVALGARGDPFGVSLILISGSAALGALIGPIYGALTAESGETVEKVEQALHQALINLRIQENFREHVMNHARTKAQYHFVALPNVGPTSTEESVSYHQLAGEGIDTVFEVQVLVLGVKETEYGISPPLCMFMRAKARLIQITDGDVLYEHVFEYKSDKRPYTDWAADEAKLFREELNSAYRTLAGEIIWATFIRPSRKT